MTERRESVVSQDGVGWMLGVLVGSLEFRLLLVLSRVADHINDDRAREDQDGIFTFMDLHPIRVPHREPALRYFGDGLAAAFETIVVFEETSLRLEIVRARNVDAEFATEQGEKLLFHRRYEVAAAIDRVARPPREKFLLDKGELRACGVLQRKFFSQRECFAIDDEGWASVCILNREVFAEGKKFLSDYVTHKCRTGLECGRGGSESIRFDKRRATYIQATP